MAETRTQRRFTAQFKAQAVTAGIVCDGDWGRLSEETFLRDFAGAVCRAGIVQKGAARRQDHPGRLAQQGVLLRRVHAGPHHQPEFPVIPGQAHGRQDD